MPARIATVVALLLYTLLIRPTAHAQLLRAQALTDIERQTVIMTLRLDEQETEQLDELAVICTIERQERIDAHNASRAQIEIEDERDFGQAIRDGYAVAAELAEMRDRMLADLALLIDEDTASRVERCTMRLNRLEWNKQAFPAIFEKHWSEAAVSRVLRADTLTDEERAGVIAYQDELEPKLVRLRADWAKALDDAESSASVEEMMTAERPMSPRLARVERRVLETTWSTHAKLERLLAPERHTLIPAPPTDPEDEDQPEPQPGIEQ